MLLLNGLWQQGEGETLLSINPATHEVCWQGRQASAQQVHHAVIAARHAFMAWQRRTQAERILVVEAYVAQLKLRQEDLIVTICEEMGKPLWEAATEVTAMINKASISIESQQQRCPDKKAALGPAVSYLRHRAHGVLAVFGPFNFPGHLANGHIIPALLAGNCVVFKPSELTPKVGQMMADCWLQAGLPCGVLNLVQGRIEVGQALLQEPQLDGVCFTGSSDTGHAIHRQFAGQPDKLLALEMGGNNPLMVTQVSHVPAAVHEIIQSAYITSGQRCTCARRLLLPRNRHGDDLLVQLSVAVKAIKVAPGNAEPAPFMGPVITLSAAEKLLAQQQALISKGATAIVPMRQIKPDSALLSPGLLLVDDIAELDDEEIFGPLLQVQRYDSFEQGINLANATRFGLAAALLSDDAQEFEHFSLAVRAGIVNWNKATTGAASSAPFGGVGASGNHRPSAYYAADYCAYPVASIEVEKLVLPPQLSPGLDLS
ncbi:succinylglutamate-semialdehyde dehydrogenase [Motilimonas pumila]|uniref:N-succinylglutamate 5-semialdehyde dehydrogenase n=1 Tax=Motilimonas pumila TaxID=2303987 RepID=A0A418YCW0_9GAMM|nr:succinylglutamate-semialdehyde dehydrogenase [Motilimonas pumila]RJG42338.1 succinylglutamate-semialdehyde dehydrogenase [Motilimonas pumila]